MQISRLSEIYVDLHKFLEANDTKVLDLLLRSTVHVHIPAYKSSYEYLR